MPKDNQSIKSCFIVGCGHSGTSLLVRLLGDHSKIWAVPEETNMFLSKLPDPVEKQIRKYEKKAHESSATYWVEKTPKHVHKIAEIKSYLPDAKIIAITRDPRDVACSIKARTGNFEEGIQRWIEDNQALLVWLDSPSVHIVRLEDLTKNSSKIIAEVLRFLELPQEDLLDYYKKPEDWYANKIVSKKPTRESGIQEHRDFRNWQINQPIFKSTRRFDKEVDSNDKRVYEQYLPAVAPLAEILDYDIGYSTDIHYLKTTLDETRSYNKKMSYNLLQLTKELSALRKSRVRATKDKKHFEKEYINIVNSKAWYLTRPLRKVSKTIGTATRGGR